MELLEEKDRLIDSLNNYRKDTFIEIKGDLNSFKKVPLKYLIQPNIDILNITQRDNYSWYDFKFWLQVPHLRKKEIESVVYYFDHPSFEQKGKARIGKYPSIN